MKFINQIKNEGKLTVRKNEERAKREYLLHRDSSLHQAHVCLHCEKPKCVGTDRCFGKEAKKRE